MAPMRDGAICLATLLDARRLPALVRLANSWTGAISAAILARDSTATPNATGLNRELETVAMALREVHNNRHRVRFVLVENPG